MTEKATDIEVGPNYTWSALLTLARVTPSNNASFLRTALEGCCTKQGTRNMILKWRSQAEMLCNGEILV